MTYKSDEIGFSFVETLKLFDVTIDNEVKFDEHVTSICKKVNQKSDIISKNGYLRYLWIWAHFDYCSAIFVSINHASLLKLEKSFMKALKQVFMIRISRIT